MLTFKDFLEDTSLLEATLISKKWESQSLDIAKAIEYLNTNCKDGLKAIANDGVLFRGFKVPPADSETVVMLDSTKALRTSRDTNNLYQIMFDASELMGDVPSRSSSFICSSNLHDAIEVSRNTYAMIPVDGTVVAECSADDIFGVKLPVDWVWDDYTLGVELFCETLEPFFECFVNAKNDKFTDINALNTSMAKYTPEEIVVIHDAIRGGDLHFDDMSREDEEMFINFTDSIRPNSFRTGSEKLKKDIRYIAEKYVATGKMKKSSTTAKGLLDILRKNPSEPFTALSNYVTDPSKLKITVKKFGENLTSNRECWFSGKCVAIPTVVFNEIVQEMFDMGMPVGKKTIDMCHTYTGGK